ncbi:MAG: hypothetical protein HY951_01185 [Bacteroidia bacterium]|nr:hypothetical protein [Bacteroidia bacterium]
MKLAENKLKFLTIILSIYIVGLTLIPCVDNHRSNDIQLTHLCKQTNDSHSSDVDLCSPFCTCSCCGSSISFVYQIFFKPISVKPSALEYFFRVPFLSEFSLSFWQPPKI